MVGLEVEVNLFLHFSLRLWTMVLVKDGLLEGRVLGDGGRVELRLLLDVPKLTIY